MEYYAIYLPLLIGILAGVLMGRFLSFKTKTDLLDELVRTNQLHSIRFASMLRSMLSEQSNTDLYIRLSCIGNQYKIPDPEAGNDLEQVKAAMRELEGLDNYLSVLELCCSLVKAGALSVKESHNLLDKQLAAINSQKEITTYIKDYALYYKNLLWYLQQRK